MCAQDRTQMYEMYLKCFRFVVYNLLQPTGYVMHI